MYYEAKPDILGLIADFDAGKFRFDCVDAKAAFRMLLNNLDPRVALNSGELVVYGGTGRAARNWDELCTILECLQVLKPDETLLVQSGAPVAMFRTWEHSPRILIANSNLVPAWATQENFDKLDRMGLMMYGQMTAGSWIYIGTQGILQGTYETFAELSRQHFGGSLKGRLVLTGGMGAMSGAQPHAVTMNEGVLLDVEVIDDRIARKVKEGYCDRMTGDLNEALRWCKEAQEAGTPLSVGLVGNIADVAPELVRRGIIPDVVTDQTSAHELMSYVPTCKQGEMLEDVLALKESNPAEYKRRALESIKAHVEAILAMQEAGAICFDYGNNLRGQAEKAGAKGVRKEDGSFGYPGFVPAYVRPLFCQGKGPFRWAAISGDPKDILTIDAALLEMFPEDKALHRWIQKAQAKIPLNLGLPTRICWLGQGDRAAFGLKINELVASGAVKGPIVIGRDHLDTGSVASPNRETEGMRDGSDIVADWALLNALLSASGGASWVSIHQGGGVGIGLSQHSGLVIVADGTPARAERLLRVLTNDPGSGVARHANAGYELAINTALETDVRIPGLNYP
ncbi:Urocanate hydratase [Candidatus Burarchaeum australiense]|nr:Urocanate hydratase [Candidatus Burarchaeum australiense]